MTLHMQFEQELTKLGSGGSGHGGRRRWRRGNSRATSSSGIRSPCRSTACALATPELASARRAPSLERIGKVALRSAHLSHGADRPIEIDAAACVVQLRSNPPQRDDDGRSYYELTGPPRRRDRARAATARRTATPASRFAATVTREVLLRLVGDFEAVLG